MTPATFAYVRATTVEEGVQALTEHGDDAKLLAGGHSLIPLMRLRFAAPEVIVDIGRVEGLRGVTETDDARLSIGALTTHQEVIEHPLVQKYCRVLATVTATVGDPQVRSRGTLAGALAHGDAAGDLPATLLALDGSVLVQGPSGRREIPAADLFVDYLTTTLAPDEVIVEVRVPKLASSWRGHYEKFTRVSHSWAIVGVLALVELRDGVASDVRVGLTNMASTPVRAAEVERALTGNGADSVAAAAEHAAESTDAPSDLNADRAYREHLARVLTRRALEATLR